jgi:hypothetical protein
MYISWTKVDYKFTFLGLNKQTYELGQKSIILIN